MTPRTVYDDQGRPVRLGSSVRRVVSLVPSLTEAVAVSSPGLLVGATDWCSHPAGLAVTRIGAPRTRISTRSARSPPIW